ncbi:MAG: substrate-binding domain-containing protein, partial [Lachnospiraceae bacterium]|nr:substrate-binding domain-containing protein [Lachnospiraceae bacterium]
MYHTKKIGVFVSHIVGEYQRSICQGIIDQASEYGYCVEIFSSTDEEIPGNYRLGEESILRIPNFDNLCGVIFISSTYVTSNLPQLISKTLEGCRCPIIEITHQHGQYPSIALDNDTGTGQLTEHLIGTHGFKRICYLGNTLETYFSDHRCNIYKQVIAKHNLPVTAQDIYECTYDSRDFEAAVEYFTATGKPDAIVCYNDRMALGMIRALLGKGYRVPEDIAVTGTDMLEEGQSINPPLTSVTFPTKEMGIHAVELLLSAIHGKELPPVTVITSDPHIGGSCGCAAKHHKNPFFFQHEMALKVGQNEATSTNNIHMAASLLATVDINEGMELLENFVSQISGCSELYLCLYSDWDSVSSHIRTITFSEDDSADRDVMFLKFAYKDGKRMHEC